MHPATTSLNPTVRKHSAQLPVFAMLLLSMGLAPLATAHAAPVPPQGQIAEALENSLSRALMTRTTAGIEALTQMERALGESVPPLATAAERYNRVLQRLESPSLQALREQLGERLNLLASMDELGRVSRSDIVPLAVENLSKEQRLILNEVANRALRVNPAWTRELEALPDLSARGGVEFIDEAAVRSASRIRENFLQPMRESEAFEAGLREAAGKESEGLLARAKGKLSEMENCLSNRSKEDTAKAQRRWWVQSMFISQGITLAGNIIGSKEVDWKTLPTDMLVNAVWSYVSSKFLFSSSKFSVQFIRMQGVGQVRSGVDAVVFYLSPLKETHGMDDFTATVDRTEYNTIYNAVSPIVTMPLQRLVQGLDCLYSGGKGWVLTTGLRYLQSTSTAMVYFRLRADYVGNGSYLLGN